MNKAQKILEMSVVKNATYGFKGKELAAMSLKNIGRENQLALTDEGTTMPGAYVLSAMKDNVVIAKIHGTNVEIIDYKVRGTRSVSLSIQEWKNLRKIKP